MSKTAIERRQEIGKTISVAMANLPDVDWTKESPEITEAQAGLDEAVTLYWENNATKRAVQIAYKAFVNAHRGGLF